ncbi:hypothetical protein BGZ65_001982 [Modicella reniformis]|uniref:E2F/DP family winged-helix DNA-binding domain-containing protein n=1 Tax=Modicella reniformis TaxID=1440133 RepID=A0A9P6MC08_9FUNG|nr:hypothetical protein BGZ65_001982 [Modicella reniformis]
MATMHHRRSQSYEDSAPYSSGLPEYTYPMAPPQRQPRSLNLHHHYRPQLEYPLPSRHSGNVSPQERQFLVPQPERIPPSPIRTTRIDDVFPLQSGPGFSMGVRSADSQLSPATPRSLPMQASIRQSVDSYSFTESPVDYRDPSGLRHTIRGYNDYSEADNIQRHESEDEDEDGVDDDESHTKRQKLGTGVSRPLPFGATMPLSRGSQSIVEENVVRERPNTDKDGEEHLEMTAGSCKQGVVAASSAQSDEFSRSKSKKPKGTAQKRGPRRTSLPTTRGDVPDQIEEDAAHAGTGSPSLAGKGLRIYAQRVRDLMRVKCSTSYNELVLDLFGGNPGDSVEDAPEVSGQENIRRRVYDALNVLNAVQVIYFDNKNIRWVGIEESGVIREVTNALSTVALAQGDPPEDGGDDESEEPEDDDMEIEKLQREVDAMKLRNELEQAKLQDQLTRQVQVLNLVKRNKRRETKEEGREARRKQRKEEKRRAMAADQESSMTDVGPQGASDHNDETRRKAERRRRRQSRRHISERPEGQVGEVMVDVEDQEENEEARRRRKQERRDRRERKEKARRRNERIQLPFVIVRMPGYTGQSSDSESSISVVRSVREGQSSKKSGKSRQFCESAGQETTMVEIQIPQQDDLSIISDTEILGDLGFNTVTMDELETMLPEHLIDTVQYTVNPDETHHPHSPRSQKGDSPISTEEEPVLAEDDASTAASITVRGGFEREIVRAASEGASSTA